MGHGMACWAGLVSEARPYDMDAPAAGWHDERVKKSAKGEAFCLKDK